MSWRRTVCVMLAFFMIHSGIARGQDKELDDQAKPEKQSLEEIKNAAIVNDYRTLNNYSFADGVASLVESKQSWREDRKCISCHTTGWGLAAQPIIDSGSDEVAEGRSFAQEYLSGYLEGDVKPHKQYGSIEGLVATAAFLAMSDARSGNEIHQVTRQGLDHAWELLDASGTWEEWLQCNWPPFESDAEFGPTLMLVALGEIRGIANLEEQDIKAAAKLSKYLQDNPPLSLHAKAMRLWAAIYWSELIPAKERSAWLEDLLDAQATDGGWSMASLAGPAWKRDGGEGQTTTSEAYPTAFVTYVLLQTGCSPEDAVILEGRHWLRQHQREGGDWFTRSPRRDRKHYISRAATAFSLLALTESDLGSAPE
jgi:hypothetical protein